MGTIKTIIFFLCLVSGVILGIQSYLRSKKIFSGKEERFRVIIMDSALAGLSLSLVLFGGVYFVATITGTPYRLESNNIFPTLLIFVIPGIFVFLGSVGHYYQMLLFRKSLLEYLIRKKEKDKN
jgi:hypothetical protein